MRERDEQDGFHEIHSSSQKDPSKYFLYIADDDGQAEEFPPLTHNQLIGRYEFPHLSLVQAVSPERASISSASSSGPVGKSDNDDSSLNDSSRSITPPVSSEARKSVISTGRPSPMASASVIIPQADPINNLHILYESLNQKTYLLDYYVKSGGSRHVKVRADVSGEQIRFELLEKTSRLTWQNLSQTTQRLVDCHYSTKDTNKKKGQPACSMFVRASPLFLCRSHTRLSRFRNPTGVRRHANARNLRARNDRRTRRTVPRPDSEHHQAEESRRANVVRAATAAAAATATRWDEKETFHFKSHRRKHR